MSDFPEVTKLTTITRTVRRFHFESPLLVQLSGTRERDFETPFIEVRTEEIDGQPDPHPDVTAWGVSYRQRVEQPQLLDWEDVERVLVALRFPFIRYEDDPEEIEAVEPSVREG
jgi:hypothetical protein